MTPNNFNVVDDDGEDLGNIPLNVKSLKAKKTPKTPVKKTKFLSISRLCVKFGMTVSQAKVALASKGYLDQHGKATKKAIDNDVVKLKTTEDKYGDRGSVEYMVWDYLVLEKVFLKPDALTLFCTFTNRSKALRRFCEAFVLAAKALGAPENLMTPDLKLDRWTKKHKLSPETVWALVQCEFHDPHFIGGPFAFETMEIGSEATDAFKKAEKIINEVHVALLGVSVKDAEFFRSVMDRLEVWLVKTLK